MKLKNPIDKRLMRDNKKLLAKSNLRKLDILTEKQLMN